MGSMRTQMSKRSSSWRLSSASEGSMVATSTVSQSSDTDVPSSSAITLPVRTASRMPWRMDLGRRFALSAIRMLPSARLISESDTLLLPLDTASSRSIVPNACSAVTLSGTSTMRLSPDTDPAALATTVFPDPGGPISRTVRMFPRQRTQDTASTASLFPTTAVSG